MTTSRRTAALMVALLVLVLGYVGMSLWDSVRRGPVSVPAPKQDTPLAGVNAVSGLDVRRDEAGRWFAAFDYFYTGFPEEGMLHVRVPTSPGSPIQYVGAMRAERGQHHEQIEVLRPGSTFEGIPTRQVQVLLSARGGTLALAERSQLIEWPDLRTWSRDREVLDKPAADALATAVALIEKGDMRSLADARRILERLLHRDPQLDAGYVELARIAMKSNWGPEGLHQAEGLLASALAIRPASVDAKILLGYVYAHQARYKQAEALFAESAASDTKNLWLWTNWGEALAMQRKTEPAIEKYRRALAAPPTRDSYDRARVDAYAKLLELLEARGDLDGVEALYRKQIADYGQARCSGADYSLFLLRKRGDTDGAATLARQAVDGQCGAQATLALAMARYVAWGNAPDPQRAQLLNEARVYLPVTPGLLYELAADDRTAPTVKKLVVAGEPIGQVDNDKFDALSYALKRQDHGAARRLLTFGARPGALVGAGQLPVALLPAAAGDVAGVRLMRQFGVDYAKLTYQGQTAIDVARQRGDRRMLDALGASDPKNRL